MILVLLSWVTEHTDHLRCAVTMYGKPFRLKFYGAPLILRLPHILVFYWFLIEIKTLFN